MATETLLKLSPNRTMMLRGFDRRGAAAAMHNSSATGFTVSGVFRDAADFCVLMLWDADDFFGHWQTTKYLPEFQFDGMTLEFDLTLTNLQSPISKKAASIAWDALSYIKNDTPGGTPGTKKLSDFITHSGQTQASRTWTVTGSSPGAGDRVALWYRNHVFESTAQGKTSVTFSFFGGSPGAEHSVTIDGTPYTYDEPIPDGASGADIAAALAGAADAHPDVHVSASSNSITITPESTSGSTITVSASDGNGSDTLWLLGSDIASAIAQQIRDQINAIAWVPGDHLPISASGSGADIIVTANAALGTDGNEAVLYAQSATGSLTLSPGGFSSLTGGTAPTSYHFAIDFSNPAVNLENVRQMWLTLAPVVSPQAYTAQEWSAVVTNWTVTDPNGRRPLKVMGPGSVRVPSRDAWATYDGTWIEEVGFYHDGFARKTTTPGNKVTIKYSCQSTHDVYIGTALSSGAPSSITVTLDGVPQPDLVPFLSGEPAPIVSRRKIASSIAAGTHLVELTVNSAGTFYFDYLDAVIPGDVLDPAQTYTSVSPATDYDTDHGYKLSPQRLVWMMERMGFRGDWNHYVGVFWWNQRQRYQGSIGQLAVTFTGPFEIGPLKTVTLLFGETSLSKTILSAQDDDATIAKHFEAYINELLVGVWASASGNVLTITSRSPIYDFTFSTSQESATGTVVVSDTNGLLHGSEGIWRIDPSATPKVNVAARLWHADLWAELNARSWPGVAAFSMELLNPPEDPISGEVWAARYKEGHQVLTATGFGTEGESRIVSVTFGTPVSLEVPGHAFDTGDSTNVSGVVPGTYTITRIDDDNFSLDGTDVPSGSFVTGSVTRSLKTTHCSFVSKVADYQKVVYGEMAGLMNTAGLTPFLQFGEFLWWFFSSRNLVPLAVANSTPVEIFFNLPHLMSNGDTLINAGYKGCSAANGTWAVTVVNPFQVALNGSAGNGAWVNGSGQTRTGSMGYYDDETEAAALSALGHALTVFNTQDDDPDAFFSGADANFLRDRIKAHIDVIRNFVLATYPSAKFELLYPNDVNHGSVYYTDDLPFPQGGRLNRRVNLPTEYETKAGSGLDRLKMEALSWGSFYRNLDRAKETIRFPYTAPLSWAKADIAYLIPMFNGGCFWEREYLDALDQGTPLINFWAFDHISLLSRPVQMPTQDRRALFI